MPRRRTGTADATMALGPWTIARSRSTRRLRRRSVATRRAPSGRKRSAMATASNTASGSSETTAACSRCASTRRPAARTEGPAMRLLVLEDEPALRETLARQFRDEGFTIDEAGDGVEGEFAGLEYPVDVAVVDLGLPGRSGLDAIRAWRKAGKNFPVLILTARDSWQEKVAGLDAGADDYVTKPFRFEEVLARVQALLRRSGGWSQPLIQCGAVALDTRAQEVRVGGEKVELTAFEYRLLEYLMLRAGQVVSKAELTEKLYEQDFERDSNTIEVFIGRLRRKLDPENRHQPIETLRGRGYRIARS